MTQHMIPPLDLNPELDLLWDDINAAIQRVLRSTRFIMGPEVQALEEELAQYLGVAHAVGVNSGTDALVIALRALGVGEGDEVITSAFTFFATGESISIIGAVPVFVDVDPHTYNLNVEQIEAAITPHTKAIIPVHLFGHAADMSPIMALAEKHGLVVVEDTAQAFGGHYQGQKLGTIGHAGAYSFFPSKNLGAYGDAGLITTDDGEAAHLARKLRAHGSLKKYHNEILGYNSRLDALQAAILRVKLPHVDDFNAGRKAAAARYHDLLADVEGITTPTAARYADHVFHQYTVRVLDGRRDALQAALKAAGIQTMVYYPVPLHQLPVYAEMGVSLPHTEQLAGEVLSLPIWPQITAELQESIINTLKAQLQQLTASS